MKKVIKSFSVVLVVAAVLMLLASPAYSFRGGDGVDSMAGGFHGGHGSTGGMDFEVAMDLGGPGGGALGHGLLWRLGLPLLYPGYGYPSYGYGYPTMVIRIIRVTLSTAITIRVPRV